MGINERIKILEKCRPQLGQCSDKIAHAYNLWSTSIKEGGTLYFCGNGGSNADSYHIVGELMKSFEAKRPLSDKLLNKMRKQYPNCFSKLSQLQVGIRSLALGSQHALTTAFDNDVDPDLIFAQELLTLGRPGDVLVCISTSGNSQNVLYAAMVAQMIGIHVILLTGARNGLIANYANVIINVPETETYKI